MSAQVERIMNCEPSPNQEMDNRVIDARNTGILERTPRFPVSVDLREGWWTIGDQMNTGSCVGWAVADSVLRWHFHSLGDLQQEGQRLSARYVWMAAKESDEFTYVPTSFLETQGTSVKAALAVAKNFGVVTERRFVFEPDKRLCMDMPKDFFDAASRRKVAEFFNLGTNPDDWRDWIANQGPVLTRLNVDDGFIALQGDKTAKLNKYLPPPADQPRGHAVALVGYTESTFIVRNSWGTGWGDGGYAYASTGYAQAAFTEAYGVKIVPPILPIPTP